MVNPKGRVIVVKEKERAKERDRERHLREEKLVENRNRRENEVQALRAIFMHEFVDVSDTKSFRRWNEHVNQNNGESDDDDDDDEGLVFDLQVSAADEDLRGLVCVDLRIRLPSRYPTSSAAVIRVQNERGISSLQGRELQNILTKIARDVVGSEAIFEIASAAKDWLSDHHSLIRGVKQVSAHDNMLDRNEREAVDREEAAKLEIERLREQEENAHREEDRTLMQKIQADIRAKEQIVLEQRRKLKALRSPVSDQNLESTVDETSGIDNVSDSDENDNDDGLEDDKLDTITTFPNLKVNFTLNELTILTQNYTNSLSATIKHSGLIVLSLARDYIQNILRGLVHLHSLGMPHGYIRDETVVFVEDEAHKSVIKLAGAGYESILRGDVGQASFKSDVYDLGCLFLSMLCGTLGFPDIERDKEVASVLISDKLLQFPPAVRSFIKSTCQPDEAQRPTLSELLRHPLFLSKDEQPLHFFVERPRQRTASEEVMVRAATELEGSLQSLASFSRYRSDFEEIAFLGEGGFGEVVKARNKIDGRYYAIKKIQFDVEDIDTSKKVLREVQLLSRLFHQFVVRYYQSWSEDARGENISLSEEEDDDEDEEKEEESESTIDSSDEHNMGDGDDWLSQEASNSFVRFAIDSNEVKNTGFSVNDLSLTDLRIEIESESEVHSPRRRRKTSTKGKDRSGRLVDYRILYIQMEYCEKKTLRDAIDDGLDEEESWRLFRQILEGLAHIHSQGVIHRDLKPSNIFLDASNNIKLGDFGLATSPEANQTAITPTTFMSVADNLNESLTGGIGTPVYVAPEIVHQNAKYNSKVDLYSLGIVFFEMNRPRFSTAMERFHVMSDIRSKEINLPSEFPEKCEAQAKIIRMLLSHLAKERPSALKLLQSGLLPPRIEEEYVQEALRTIIGQNNSLYYSQLMDALFGQTTDAHKDYTFDFKSGPTELDPFRGMIAGKVQAVITDIFHRHGAVHIAAPLLVPKLEKNLRKVVELMDSNGGIVELPYDLTFPFARYISRLNLDGIDVVKRFSFDKVYRRNMTGGQPWSVSEVDFDIVHSRPNLSMIPEAEVLKVVIEVLDEFNFCRSHIYKIRLNHDNILELLLDISQFPPGLLARKAVYHFLEQLDRSLTWSQFRNQILQQVPGITRANVDLLELFNSCGSVETVFTRLDDIIKNYSGSKRQYQDCKGKVEALVASLHALGVTADVEFSPLLSYNSHYYRGGIIFQVGFGSRRKLDVVACGGRYDSLLHSFQHPGAKRLHAVGANIALQKIINMVSAEQSGLLRQWISRRGEADFLSPLARRCDVLVVGFGQQVGLQERLAVVKDIWSIGISADLMLEDVRHPDDAASEARLRGVSFLVILKPSGKNTAGVSIKVKNMRTRNEEEVSSADLLSYIQSEMDDTPSTFGAKLSSSTGSKKDDFTTNSNNNNSSSTTVKFGDTLNISVLQFPGKNKLKYRQKQVIIEKARTQVNSVVSIRGPMVFAVDLARETVLRMSEVSMVDDEGFRRVVLEPEKSILTREYMSQVRNRIVAVMNEGEARGVWLYSTKDDYSIFHRF